MVLNNKDIEYMLFNKQIENQTEFQLTKVAHEKFLIDYEIGAHTLFQGTRDIIFHSGPKEKMTLYKNARVCVMNKHKGYIGFKCQKYEIIDYSEILITRNNFISKLKKS